MSKKYLTEKEACARYGYSKCWFLKGRAQGYGPHFIQLRIGGRILYPLDETDAWFKKKLEINE